MKPALYSTRQAQENCRACHGNEGARHAILAGIDSIEHGSFIEDPTLYLMKEHGTVYVPTLIAGTSLIESLSRGRVMDPHNVAKPSRQWTTFSSRSSTQCRRV